MRNRFSALAGAGMQFAGLAGWPLYVAMSAPNPNDHPDKGPVYLNSARQSAQNEAAMGLQQQVDSARKKAAGQGNYACCIRPACSWCLLHIGRCKCVMTVGSGRAACRECKGGWEADQGRLPGRTKIDIRKMKTLTDKDNDVQQLASSVPATEKSQTLSSAGNTSNANAPRVLDGQKLFEDNNCRSCHKMDGTGGTGGPELTHESQRHAEKSWQIEHLKNPAKVSPGSTMPSFARLKPEELEALAAYLVSKK